jgi:uncharacterized membrane protein YphA (DoxX/SURF4 family)
MFDVVVLVARIVVGLLVLTAGIAKWRSVIIASMTV